MNERVERLVRIQKSPLVIGHRGLPATWPENTMPSYEAAIVAKADMVELDFRPTTDGVLVCAHDDTIGRYMSKAAPSELRARRFSSFSWKELAAMDFGAWKGEQFAGTRLATLEQVLERFIRGVDAAAAPVLLIEHKDGTPEETLTLLKRFDATEQVIVQSFDWTFLRGIHALAPELALVALGGGAVTASRIGDLLATGSRAAHWSDYSLRSSEVEALHAAGLPVWAYTLNSETSWRGARQIGLDGITTDRCDVVRDAMK